MAKPIAIYTRICRRVAEHYYRITGVPAPGLIRRPAPPPSEPMNLLAILHRQAARDVARPDSGASVIAQRGVAGELRPSSLLATEAAVERHRVLSVGSSAGSLLGNRSARGQGAEVEPFISMMAAGGRPLRGNQTRRHRGLTRCGNHHAPCFPTCPAGCPFSGMKMKRRR